MSRFLRSLVLVVTTALVAAGGQMVSRASASPTRTQSLRSKRAALPFAATDRRSKQLERRRGISSAAPGRRIPRARLMMKLQAAGIGTRRMADAMGHIELGMPTPADGSSATDLLLARNEYVVSYNAHTNTPNWVAFQLEGEDLGEAPRTPKFRQDPTLPEAWGRASDSDYKGSGYTRGHLVDSGSRSATPRMNRKTFVLTNAVPQTYENNAGPWNDLEMHLRHEVEVAGNDVYVYAGPIYDTAKPPRIGGHKIAVPDALWKLAVIVPKGQGLAGVHAQTRVISVIIPNTRGSVTIADTFDNFRVTPGDIQARAGVELLTSLPDDVRAALLQTRDTTPVTQHFAKPFKMGDLRRHFGGNVPASWVAVADGSE